eukprot:COSAG04_NODE_5864_length_1468_cov_9.029218_3_plen_92_part_01
MPLPTTEATDQPFTALDLKKRDDLVVKIHTKIEAGAYTSVEQLKDEIEYHVLDGVPHCDYECGCRGNRRCPPPPPPPPPRPPLPPPRPPPPP